MSGSEPARPGATPDRLDALEGEVRQLQEALVGRAVIDQAKGVLMLHLGVSAEGAFDVLRRWSSRSNTKVAAISRELVDAAIHGQAAVAELVLELPRRASSEDGDVGGS